MRLFAEKKLTMSSASDISFAGKKRITLIGGGVTCGWRRGNRVRYDGDVSAKVKRTMAAGAASVPVKATTGGVFASVV
jgi:type VI secretion system secreted protein VgrG